MSAKFKHLVLLATDARKANLYIDTGPTGWINVRCRTPDSHWKVESLASASAHRRDCYLLSLSAGSETYRSLHVGSAYFPVSEFEAAQIAEKFDLRWRS